MDQIASVLLSFPNDDLLGDPDNAKYDKLIRVHAQKVAKLINDQYALISEQADEILKLLNPAVNSLSYLTIVVEVLLQDASTPGKATMSNVRLLDHIVILLMQFDARQMRYGGQNFTNLLALIGNGQIFPPAVAVNLLAAALQTLEPTGTMFTSSHYLLAKLAYNSNTFEPAMDVLNKPIVYYPGMTKPLDNEPKYLCDMRLAPSQYISTQTQLTSEVKPSMVMEYDLFCGMIHLARRDWKAAVGAFERVVTYPTRDGGASNLMVNAYRRWLLAGLLLNGKSPSLPPYTGNGAQKAINAMAKPYQSLATLFESANAGQLRQEVEAGGSQWDEDGTRGLVAEVAVAYQKWHIINLRNVYTKVSIPEIRAQTKSATTGAPLATDAEVLALVRDMLAAGMFRGRLDEAAAAGGTGGTGVASLTFLSDVAELSEADFAHETRALGGRYAELQTIFRATDQRLHLTREHLKFLGKKQDKDGARDAGIGFDAQVEDEDLMSITAVH